MRGTPSPTTFGMRWEKRKRMKRPCGHGWRRRRQRWQRRRQGPGRRRSWRAPTTRKTPRTTRGRGDTSTSDASDAKSSFEEVTSRKLLREDDEAGPSKKKWLG
jgi:hypothetical protein